MAKDIEVIFTETKKGFFTIGKKKRVKLGYFKNYLFPKGLAVLVNKHNETVINRINKETTKHSAKLEQEAKALQKDLKNETITFIKKAQEEGKLYGSVTTVEIAEAINKTYNKTLDKYDIKVANIIKEVGSYDAWVVIHPEVEIKMTIEVNAEIDKNAKKVVKIQKPNKEEAKETVEEPTKTEIVENEDDDLKEKANNQEDNVETSEVDTDKKEETTSKNKKSAKEKTEKETTKSEAEDSNTDK